VDVVVLGAADDPHEVIRLDIARTPMPTTTIGTRRNAFPQFRPL
jgi:hypothetical protein